MTAARAPSEVVAALRHAFDLECRELGLKARLSTEGERLTPCFEAQFGAGADWLQRTFAEELRERGVPCDPALSARALEEVDLAQLLEHLRSALRRTRGRMVDANSWNSGGFDWPFDVQDTLVRSRGLAVYRAPARAAAKVKVRASSVTIAFPSDDFGEIASAGIWVPTELAGDFDLTASYRCTEWRSGERDACVGLFAVATDGTFRMYAQRVARAADPTRAVADLDGSPGPVHAICAGASGALRISRDRGLLCAWHRDRENWTWLGRARQPATRTLIVGIKVWASGRCGPLKLDLEDFRLSGTAAPRQGPPPAARRDPRQLW